MAGSKLRTSLRADVLSVVIDRSEVRNAIDAEAADPLASTNRGLEGDNRARVMVVSGGHRCVLHGAVRGWVVRPCAAPTLKTERYEGGS